MKITTTIEIKKDELFRMVKDYLYNVAGTEFLDDADINIDIDKNLTLRVEVKENLTTDE